MNEKEIFTRVRKVVADTLGIGETELSADTRVKEDLGADSLQVVTIVIALDEEFDIEFNMDDLPQHSINLKWISDFVAGTISAKQ